MDAAAAASVNMTAQMLGLPPEMVTKILQIGLPMMATMAETNPDLLKPQPSRKPVSTPCAILLR